MVSKPPRRVQPSPRRRPAPRRAFRVLPLDCLESRRLLSTATSFTVTGPSDFTAGTPESFTVTAVDNNGDAVTDYAGTVHLTSSDPQAVLPPDATLTNGTGDFTVTYRSANFQTLTATDSAAGINGEDGNVLVYAAAASQFVVSTPPGGAAGVPEAVTIMAEDPYGNIADGYTGTVDFTSSDPQATLPAPSTLNVGEDTFAVNFGTVGPQTITATDSTTPSLTGTSGPATITAAAVATVDTFVGVTQSSPQHLEQFTSAAPGTPTDLGAVTGLDAGDVLVALTFDPTNATLYGFAVNATTGDGQLYRVVATGATATPLGGAFNDLGGSGTGNFTAGPVGFGYDPVTEQFDVFEGGYEDVLMTDGLQAVSGSMVEATPAGLSFTNEVAEAGTDTGFGISLTPQDGSYDLQVPDGQDGGFTYDNGAALAPSFSTVVGLQIAVAPDGRGYVTGSTGSGFGLYGALATSFTAPVR